MNAGTRTLTPARAVQGRRLRVDPRALCGLLLIVLSVAVGILYAGSINQGRGVVIAARDLPVGAILGPNDLLIASARLDDSVYAAAIPAAEAAALIGRPLGEPVHARQVLVRAQLASGLILGPDQEALTIPVKPENAAGGRLRPGDAVRVRVTIDKGKPTSKTEVVIDRAIVYATGKDDRTRIVSNSANGAADTTGGVGDAGSLATLTLILTPDQAQALAHARWDGDLDVTLLPPTQKDR